MILNWLLGDLYGLHTGCGLHLHSNNNIVLATNTHPQIKAGKVTAYPLLTFCLAFKKTINNAAQSIKFPFMKLLYPTVKSSVS